MVWPPGFHKLVCMRFVDGRTQQKLYILPLQKIRGLYIYIIYISSSQTSMSSRKFVSGVVALAPGYDRDMAGIP